MLLLLRSPLVLLPEEGVLHAQDLDDPELGLRHCLVEKAVHCAVTAVFTWDGHLQEVLGHRHRQPRFRKKAGWVGGGRRERMRRREIHGWRGGGGKWGRGGGAGQGSRGEAAQRPRQGGRNKVWVSDQNTDQSLTSLTDNPVFNLFFVSASMFKYLQILLISCILHHRKLYPDVTRFI